jgi:methionyl-tRNA formyltransferase
MRVVFAGTPSVAVPSLELVAAAHDVAAVITREDAPVGRKRVLTPSPVADAAESMGLDVIRANRLDEAVTARIAELEPELGVIVAYGGLLREPLLGTPTHGWINLHFSDLPRWRGAAPVQWTVISGDREAGASVFQLVAELDAGPVFARLSTPVGAHETAGALLNRLAVSGGALLHDVVAAIGAGTAEARPQEGQGSYAPKLGQEDGRLDLGRPADEVYARFRGVTPEPGAHLELEGMRLKVLDCAPLRDHRSLASGTVTADGRRVLAGTADAPLELLEVQPAGKRPMRAADWWRGVAAETLEVVR